MWIFYHDVTSSIPVNTPSEASAFNFIIGVTAMFIVGFLPMMIIHMAGKKNENR